MYPIITVQDLIDALQEVENKQRPVNIIDDEQGHRTIDKVLNTVFEVSQLGNLVAIMINPPRGYERDRHPETKA